MRVFRFILRGRVNEGVDPLLGKVVFMELFVPRLMHVWLSVLIWLFTREEEPVPKNLQKFNVVTQVMISTLINTKNTVFWKKKPIPEPSGKSGHQWVFPNLDSSRIHCSQNCWAWAAWIPAASALQVPSHTTEHSLEYFYFAVGFAEILDVQSEMDLSREVPSWDVVLSCGHQPGAERRCWLALQTCSGPSFCTCPGAGNSELCLVTLCRCHSESPPMLVVMATLKKTSLSRVREPMLVNSLTCIRQRPFSCRLFRTWLRAPG